MFGLSTDYADLHRFSDHSMGKFQRMHGQNVVREYGQEDEKTEVAKRTTMASRERERPVERFASGYSRSRLANCSHKVGRG